MASSPAAGLGTPIHAPLTTPCSSATSKVGVNCLANPGRCCTTAIVGALARQKTHEVVMERSRWSSAHSTYRFPFEADPASACVETRILGECLFRRAGQREHCGCQDRKLRYKRNLQESSHNRPEVFVSEDIPPNKESQIKMLLLFGICRSKSRRVRLASCSALAGEAKVKDYHKCNSQQVHRPVRAQHHRSPQPERLCSEEHQGGFAHSITRSKAGKGSARTSPIS